MNKPVLVIMAAGMGSRYGGLKQLDPVDNDGHIIMDFSMYDAKRAGFEKVVFIIKHEIEEEFKEHVGKRMEKYMDVAYAYQNIDNIPEGEYQLKMKPVIRIPEGSYYAAVEGSRGEFGVFIESRGDKFPYRMKFRSTGLPLVSCLETIARGTKIADLIAIGGTLDYVVPDIDR